MRFLFIDEIHELVPGKRIVAIAHIADDEAYFADHFPGFPVVPGVLLTEMMGQAAARCLDHDLENRGKAILARIKSAGFRGWVRPGETVALHAEIRSDREQFATAACKAEVAGKEVASAELMFGFLPITTFPADLRRSLVDQFARERPGRKLDT